jgi:hypothetical protein
MRHFASMFLSLLLASFVISIPVRADDAAPAKKMVVFIAGHPSHGFAQHEHNAGCLLLARLLKEGMPNFDDRVYTNGWPTDPHALDGADAIVMYCDGGPGHMVIPHLAEVDALTKKGVGIGCIHYAVEIPKDKGGQQFLDWIGGYFETYWSVNPVWQRQAVREQGRVLLPHAVSSEYGRCHSDHLRRSARFNSHGER